ncbi:2', 3'-cyclic nucleotide 2'-phosphodiesterase [Halostagnicola larsenii XH-48]|uniref:2', 3'-cyclic nucleotide 2'-phosphodiesterase n=1 Tax=Halostagnicola larsenii XH-48 TaxID=797299 RepID=W0JR72_9EURY|nr:5'-nucleotidase C-terminal domain-containing protein [Halostagnicola larsenii]AHF99477.1 2', 3'-cyclic nucleotide 2'-phosphodiesterase [Halostagnicola larsenii XH-48]
MSIRLVQYSDVENACDYPQQIGRLVRAIRERSDDKTLLLGTGDNTSPGVLPLVTDGKQALEFYDAIEPDVETFGNHDFDYGYEATLEVVRSSPHQWVTANVLRNGDPFGAEVGVEPWVTVERNGTTVGVTGVTTQRTGSLNPMATGLSFRDPIEAADEAVAELRAAGADIVVICSHLGGGDDALARAVDADVILGGHVPSTRLERIDGTLVTRPGDGGDAIVEVTVASEPTSRIVRTDEYDPAPDVVDAFRELEESTGLTDVVATVDEPIERIESTLFGGESRVGNFVADAYRWATGADVGLQNSGGIRSGDALQGEVTASDLIGLIPFDEPVATATLTGEQLAAVFNGAAGIELGFAEPGWWHAHVSGITLEWDSVDHNVSIRRVNSEPFDPEATYELATSDYLFHTDDEFPALRPASRTETTDGTQYDVLLEYARECGIDPAIEGRIRRRY